MNFDNVTSVIDITDRADELRDEREDFEHDDDGNRTASDWAGAFPDDAAELAALESLLSEIRGYGGDHRWEGDWYPGELIRDSYFTDYAQQLAEDIGAVNADVAWPNNCIDWDKAADLLQQDYSSVDFDGDTYWYR